MALYRKGQSGNPAGKKKGTPNKVTKDLKKAFLQTFDALGGTKGLIQWASENRDVYYPMISKMLPRDLQLKTEQETTINIISHIPEPLPLEPIDMIPPQLPGPGEECHEEEHGNTTSNV